MGSPPGNVTQSTTSWLREKPCHTDGPSPNSSKCHWPSHRTCQTNQLEGADHSKLKQLQYYIEYSVNHSISLSKLLLQLLLYHASLELLIHLLQAVTNTPYNYSALSTLFQHLPLTSDTLGDHQNHNLER